MKLLFALLAALTSYLKIRNDLLRHKSFIKMQHPLAEQAFAGLNSKSDEDRFGFNSQSAEVMLEKARVEYAEDAKTLVYSLTRVVRNPFGEYFWFSYRSDSKTLFKHLDHGRARYILKGKYLEPGFMRAEL